VAVATPVLEIVAAALVLLVSVKTGAALSLVLLGGFSLAVLRARSRQGDRIPCGCFGRAKERDYRLIIGRNLLLVGVTAVVLLGEESQGLLSGGEVPPASDVLPALLAAVGIGLMAVVLWQAGKVMSSTTGTARVKR
jgi:hypothetical protein